MAKRTLEDLEEAVMRAGLEVTFSPLSTGARKAWHVASDAERELLDALALAIVRRPDEARAWAERYRELRRGPGMAHLSAAYLARLLEVLGPA